MVLLKIPINDITQTNLISPFLKKDKFIFKSKKYVVKNSKHIYIRKDQIAFVWVMSLTVLLKKKTYFLECKFGSVKMTRIDYKL